MQHLLLTFASQHTFTVTDETSGETLGQISYMIGENAQPHGFIFTTCEGRYSHRKVTMSEALKELLGEDIRIRLDPIV